MIKAFVLTLCIGSPLVAQEMKNYIFHLDNGARVLYQTYSQISMPDDEKAFGTATASGNIIRRTMLDENRKPWLAFELHVDREPGDGPIRFFLSMEPVGGWSFFHQRPVPREIVNGDRVLLDVLEQPDTGRKIFDTFQLGIGVPMQIMPMPESIPQTPVAGIQVRLQSPRFMKGLNVFAKNEGTVTGTQVALLAPGEGRFTFSSQPEPGFRMEAISDGKRLLFVAGEKSYRIECSQPVVDVSGSWYLWVKHELAPQGPGVAAILELSVR
jgi:hypothetical protein